MSGFARGRRAKGAPPLLYGHRGTRRGAPENSLLAMRRALEQGADGIELDVRLCKSGELVVLHDPDLLRVAGVKVVAAQATLAELRAHDLGQGERVPRLEQALDLVLGAGQRLNIECKPDVPDPDALVQAVAACVRARSAEEQARVVFSSFSAVMCGALCAALPQVAVGFLFDRLPAALPEGIAAVHPFHALVTRETRAEFAARGFVVNVWTVNDAARAAELARTGVDGIITDDLPLVASGLAG